MLASYVDSSHPVAHCPIVTHYNLHVHQYYVALCCMPWRLLALLTAVLLPLAPQR
jgi:hypothetical protein